MNDQIPNDERMVLDLERIALDLERVLYVAVVIALALLAILGVIVARWAATGS